MPTHYIEVTPATDQLAILSDRIRELDRHDELVIIMDAKDAHQQDRVFEFLRLQGFDYQPQGSHDGNEYRVIAKRRFH
ncbi:hypothetical protein F9B85_11330 [Heliorestis acidaminivorans]|uniref:Sulfurtransferase TusA family protein n=1 Tax=Heliorestis acidaminivorans TaxID=553427 RepID=A0A6I0ESL8_9FIRM|nr:hypothetical protein [Heliorestis acidaminivorans]KAB2951862.1 hypothetical protein F9B85_11330 [Heliorestis acidaminivorans]